LGQIVVYYIMLRFIKGFQRAGSSKLVVQTDLFIVVIVAVLPGFCGCRTRADVSLRGNADKAYMVQLPLEISSMNGSKSHNNVEDTLRMVSDLSNCFNESSGEAPISFIEELGSYLRHKKSLLANDAGDNVSNLGTPMSLLFNRLTSKGNLHQSQAETESRAAVRTKLADAAPSEEEPIYSTQDDVHTIPEQSLLKKARGDKQKMMCVYELLKKKSDTDPDNVPLKLACADALISMMRISTHANGLTCHFRNKKPEIRKMDTTENRKLWAKWAPVAEGLLGEIKRSVGVDVFVNDGSMFSLGVEASMYATASKGIVSSLLSGDASRFISNVKTFHDKHESWDGFQPYTYLGAMFLAAPWPKHDTKKGAECFEKAARKAPASRRNQYFDGVGRFARGDYEGAREAMERTLMTPSPSDSEKDIREFCTQEATRTIQMLEAEGY